MWTTRSVVDATADLFARKGLDEARLDAELLLAHALGVRRFDLFLDRDRPLTAPELDRYRALVKERAGARAPTAYLTGKREFYSLELEVTRDVLIPRADTEKVVDLALEELARRAAAGEKDLLVADLGTGSGAIAVAVAKLSKAPLAKVYAVDASERAAALARRNAERHGVADRVEVLTGDWFAPLAGRGLEGKLALIASNPPYVGSDERATLAPEVLNEPAAALFAGADGLDAIRAILAAAPRWLAPGGLLLVEHGATQGPATVALALAAGFKPAETRQDFGRRDRVLFARARATSAAPSPSGT